MRFSFKSKIAISSLLLTLVFLLISSVGVFTLIQNVNKNAATSVLKSELDQIVSAAKSMNIQSIVRPLAEPQMGQLAFIRNPTGQILLNSLQKLSQVEMRRLQALPTQEVLKFDSSQGTFWVLKSSFSAKGGIWNAIVAKNADIGSIIAKGTLFLFASGALILIFLVGFGAWWISRLVLKPVTAMQHDAAQMIRGVGFTPLPVSSAGDELSDLAITLNELLTQVHTSLAREKRLVADVSHELRTPLSVLHAKLQLMERNQPNATSDADLKILKDGVRNMSAMVDNLLFLARKDQDVVNHEITPEEVEETLLEAVDQARLLGLSNNINIDYRGNVETPLPLSVEELRRILENLLGNAIAASKYEGRISIEFGADEHSQHLSISDDGEGLPEEFIPHAFERFSRADNSRSRETGGSGLGLSLVKTIVDASRGSMEILNVENSGAIIKIIWPR